MSLPSSDDVVGALLKDGFHPRGKPSRGSHQVFRKESQGETRTVVVPLSKREIPLGTLHSIIRQAGAAAINVAALLK